MEWMLGLIVNLLGNTPEGFSPAAYGFAQNIGTQLPPFAMYIMVLLWGIDFINSTLSFSDKTMEIVLRHVIMLGLGVTFTNAAFFLVMGLFNTFNGWFTFTGDLAANIDFATMTEQTRIMIAGTPGIGGASGLGETQSMIMFVFLIFTILSFFGILLGMLLVPISIFVEIYIYAAFSPIPIATLFTGRKEVGIAFIKLVISVSLRGAVVLFGVQLAIHIMAMDIFTANVGSIHGFWAFLTPVITISVSLLILQKCVKGAESFAKSIVGLGA